MGVESSRGIETENKNKEFRQLYEKKFINGITDQETLKFSNLKKKYFGGEKLPSEDPIISLMGFESYEKGLGE
jgi:hypothetical protein